MYSTKMHNNYISISVILVKHYMITITLCGKLKKQERHCNSYLCVSTNVISIVFHSFQSFSSNSICVKICHPCNLPFQRQRKKSVDAL